MVSTLWFIISMSIPTLPDYKQVFRLNYCVSPSIYSNFLHCHNVLALIKYIAFNLTSIQGTTRTIQCTEITPCTDTSRPSFFSLQSNKKYKMVSLFLPWCKTYTYHLILYRILVSLPGYRTKSTNNYSEQDIPQKHYLYIRNFYLSFRDT